MRVVAAFLVAVFVAAAGYLGYYYVPATGVLVRLEPRLASECAKVPVFPGTEDVTIDPSLNLAFISADDRRATAAGKPRQGGIYAMSIDDSVVRRVGGDGFGPFHPHGISLWRGPSGEKRLFAINHRTATEDSVEIFDVGLDGGLTHARTIALPAGSNPNDLVAVGSEAFYYTNDYRFKDGLGRALETYLILPFSNVTFYDGKTLRRVVDGLRFANGINIAANGKDVYVTEFFGRRLLVYARGADGGLTRKKSYRLNFGPDNIEVARDGGLWIAGHDNVFAFLAHARDPKKISPSRIMRLALDNGDHADLFIDTTGLLNASSVGAVWDKTLIVGAVFDDHVMSCPLLDIFFRNAPVYSN